jgi:rhodanese-related sulfurtransferase
MNKHIEYRCSSLLLVGFLGLVALACGGAEQAAVEPEPEATATPPVTTQAEPVPELRTNEAGAVLVTQAELLRMIDAGTAPMVLDVRTPEEYAEGHVPGAINISHDELPERLDEVASARDTGVIVYCRSGRRAGIAEELLLAQGFNNVQHLEGDMIAWLEADRPIDRQQ